MIIPERIIEVIKAKSFAETGLKNIVSDRDYEIVIENVARKTGTTPIGINTWKRMFGHLLKPDPIHWVVVCRDCHSTACSGFQHSGIECRLECGIPSMVKDKCAVILIRKERIIEW